MCHGVDRAGSPPAFPSLVDIEKRLTTQKITGAIRQGTGRMPSFPNIDAAKLAQLLEYLGTASSKGAPKEMASAPAAGPHAQVPVDPAGAATYKDKCAVCHGGHFEGLPPSFPMLIGVGNRLSAAQAARIIQRGKGAMPAAPEVQGKELAALLRYLGVHDRVSSPANASGADRYTFTGYRKFLDPEGYPAIAPPWGTLNAIDMKTGRYLWKIPLGEYPDLAGKGMENTGSENYGGPIVTAGGVLFIGATVYDRKFRAFDSNTGKLLWEYELPFAGMATPATYMIDGQQYVVIVSSGGRDPKSPVGGAYIAFALPR